MSRKTFVASVLAFAISAGSAGAADSNVSWNGFYAGIHAGSVHMHNQYSETLNFGETGSVRNSGGIYGGLAGYNWRYGNFVSGFELDIAYSTASVNDALIDLKSELRLAGNGRLRVGVVVDRTLFFAAGGISFARFEQVFDPSNGFFKQKYFGYGLTIGGGIETYLMPNWLFRAEYLYTNYATFDQVYSYGDGHAPTDISISVARAALIYQFGGSAPQPVRNAGPADWNGAYIGAHAGQSSMSEQHAIWSFGSPAELGSTKDRATFFGALAGVNFQRGPWVSGFEIDFGMGKLRTYEDANALFVAVETRLLWDAHIRARVGYTYGNYLLYVSGGMALAHIQQTTDIYNGPSTNLFTGYTYGGGIEAMLSPNFIFRVEYLYTRYDDTTANFDIDTDVTVKTIRAAVIYKYETGSFGSPAAPRPSNWSGAYFGVHGGQHQLTQIFSSQGEIDTFRFNGLKGGVLAGFNRQDGNLVWGFEVDGGMFDGKSLSKFSACLCDEVKIKGVFDNHWRIRLGYAFGQYLPFVTAGIAFGRFEQSPSLDSTKSRIHTGFTYGAGIDTMLMENWLLRLEYLLTDYDQRVYNYASTGGVSTDVENKTRTFRAALIYRFD